MLPLHVWYLLQPREPVRFDAPGGGVVVFVPVGDGGTYRVTLRSSRTGGRVAAAVSTEGTLAATLVGWGLDPTALRARPAVG